MSTERETVAAGERVMSKHTPGPWRVYERDAFVVAAGAGFSICDAAPGNPVDVSLEAAVANARLIAAAPELLQTVNDWLTLREWCIESGGTDGPLSQDAIAKFAEMLSPIVDAMRAAVAKAEGRS